MAYTIYEKEILRSIQLEDFEANNNTTLLDVINEVYKIFSSEMKHQNNTHIPDEKIFEDWLQGLCGTVSVEFENYKILNIARSEGIVFKNQKKEDEFLNNWFKNLSLAFFTLKENL